MVSKSQPAILSLLDFMRNFEAWRFADLVQYLAQYRWIAYYRKTAGAIDAQVAHEIHYYVTEYLKHCQELKLSASVNIIKKRLDPKLRGAYGPITWDELGNELGILWDALGPEMSMRRFAYVAESKAIQVDEMLERERGEEKLANPWADVWNRFPSAKEDIEEAVYCYALERNTACIFHLMRTAEVGMRGLARRLKVKMPNGKRLEWSDWGAILREMNKKIENFAQTMKAGPAKDDVLEFYRGSLGQFYAFKDEYRNHVSHKRKSYDENHAKHVLTHVCGFMQKLSARTDERGRKLSICKVRS